MREKQPSGKIKIEHLHTFPPITQHQQDARNAWKKEGNHLVMSGCAGTGKTFTALYMALEDVLDKSTPWDKIEIVRSVVPTREVGFLPGSIDEKLHPFSAPYMGICSELFDNQGAYERLVEQGVIEFSSTSFIRGNTFDGAIIIVDEMQNLTFHELDSVITRVGVDSRIIFCGDFYQSDFRNESDKKGLKKFLEIVEMMKHFSIIEFDWSDIVRSDFVRDYIMTKDMIERNK